MKFDQITKVDWFLKILYYELVLVNTNTCGLAKVIIYIVLQYLNHNSVLF